MTTGQLICNGKIWVEHVEVATTTLQRMRGLLGRRELPVGHGLLIESCGSIHTVGMHFPIDVLFLDRTWQVRRVCHKVPPGKLMVWGGWHGLRALEVAAGWLAVVDMKNGTQVEWRETAIRGRKSAVRPS